MELDSAGSTSGLEDLDSMLLMSHYPAPDPSLMRWLLGDNRAGSRTKVERVEMVDHVGDNSSRSRAWSPNAEIQSSSQSPRHHPMTQNFLSNDRIASERNGTGNGSGSFIPKRDDSHGHYLHPDPDCAVPSLGVLPRISPTRRYINPASFPSLSRAPSLPIHPSEVNFASFDASLAHYSAPSHFMASSEAGPFLSAGCTPFPPSYLPPVEHPSSTGFPTPVLPHIVPSSKAWSRQNSLPSSRSLGLSTSVPPYPRSLSQNYEQRCVSSDQYRTSKSAQDSQTGFAHLGRHLGKLHPFHGNSIEGNPNELLSPTFSAFSSPGPISPYQQRISSLGRMSSVDSKHFNVGEGKGGFDSGVVAINLLLKSALEVDRGNMEDARDMIARLKQIVYPRGENSLHRVSFYFMDALVTKMLGHSSHPSMKTRESSFDVFQKVSAYKRFCEISPLPQFAYFTSNQTILEAMEAEDVIHVIDFEVGFGVQWASLLQDIAARSSDTGRPCRVRLTVVGTASSQLDSTGESLRRFAGSLDLSLDFRVVACPQNQLTLSSLELREGEAVAVNFVLSLHKLLLENSSDSLNSVLRLVRETRPKVVTVVELEANHNVSLFHERFVEALQYYTFLFDSLNGGAEGTERCSLDEIMMIEKFLLAPQIVNIVSCEGNERIRRHEKLRLWRARLVAAGFHALPLSGRNTLQAEYVLSSLKSWSGGYEIVKDEGGLFLSWQKRPLIAASAWRCTC